MIEDEALVVAMAREQRRRLAVRQLANEGAVLGRVARDDGIRENLGAVVERVRQYVRNPLVGTGRQVVQNQIRAELATSARGTTAATATTAAASASRVRGRSRAGLTGGA